MKQKFLTFWKYAKAVAIPVATTAATFAAQGYFGPKAAAVAAAIGTLWGVFSKRPTDDHTVVAPEAK